MASGKVSEHSEVSATCKTHLNCSETLPDARKTQVKQTTVQASRFYYFSP